MPKPIATENNKVAHADVALTYKAPEPTIVDPITIILDPAEPDKYHLRLDFRAMKLIEKETGDIMWDGSIFEKGMPTPTKLLVYIWACLQWEHPNLTQDELEVMPGFHLMNMPYLTDRFYANWTSSMPELSTDSNDSGGTTDPN